MKNAELKHEVIRQELKKLGIRTKDLAIMLEVTPQMASYVIHHGSADYAPVLAKVLGCQEASITSYLSPSLRMPNGWKIKDGRVIKPAVKSTVKKK